MESRLTGRENMSLQTGFDPGRTDHSGDNSNGYRIITDQEEWNAWMKQNIALGIQSGVVDIPSSEVCVAAADEADEIRRDTVEDTAFSSGKGALEQINSSERKNAPEFYYTIGESLSENVSPAADTEEDQITRGESADKSEKENSVIQTVIFLLFILILIQVIMLSVVIIQRKRNSACSDIPGAVFYSEGVCTGAAGKL